MGIMAIWQYLVWNKKLYSKNVVHYKSNYMMVVQKNLKDENVRQLGDAIKVSFEYLTDTEILSIYQKLSDDNKQQTNKQLIMLRINEKGKRGVVHFGNSLYKQATEQALSAGLGEGYTDNIETCTVYWDKQGYQDIGIPIKGDSMEPEFHYGQTALIKYQSSPDYDGQVCAVDNVSMGNAFIKCVTVEEDGLLLQSLNSKFPDIKLYWDDNPRIIGKVVAASTPIERDFFILKFGALAPFIF
uniref:Phage repressor-like protein n=1 Tax=Lactococcus lactis subsp. lactis bv. diacetylactis TaxID=44688 RepID=G1FKY3_LACLL|nr:S24 family peptidase [Lactococcus lactis]AEK97280.1 phage repressor-like protein [Lactococcus lactis subsp. lactis bv. diacetylactis]